MKLLKIESDQGFFLKGNGAYESIDRISKEDLIGMVDQIIKSDDVELDEYREDLIKNQAHQVVYKSVYDNLKSLLDRRAEFVDESDRMYLEDYKRYVESTPKSGD